MAFVPPLMLLFDSLQQRVWRPPTCKVQARIVNRTPHTLSLKIKCRDVWEDTKITIGKGQSLAISLTPEEANARLGVSVQTTDKGTKPTAPQVFITVDSINKELLFSFSTASNRYELKLVQEPTAVDGYIAV